MSKQGFSKQLRLLNSSDFQAVFDDAPFRASHKHLLILARPNNRRFPRLGLVIAKKNIRLAAQRNRIKRLVRETFRLQQQQLAGIDAVVLARRGMDELDNQQLNQQLNQQWQRVKKKARKFYSAQSQAPADSGEASCAS